MKYNPTKPYKSNILAAIESTWSTSYLTLTRRPTQPYPIIRPYHGCLYEIDHTDGIGTKGVLHSMYKTWNYAAQDALAMNMNDLLAARATPYKIQNHLTLQEDDHNDIVMIVEELAKLCRQHKIAMTGGETSIMDTVKGMDLSITMTGFVHDLRGSYLETGDLLVGLPSNGVHANGTTMVRKYFAGADLRKFTEPTTIYWDKVFPLLDHINACIHIAGGGFTRLKDYMQPDQGIRIWKFKKRHSIFDEIKERSAIYEQLGQSRLTDEEMYSTFNCGIGMILSIPRNKVDYLTPLGGEVIGDVVSGDGSRIVIESIFDNRVLNYNTKEGQWITT